MKTTSKKQNVKVAAMSVFAALMLLMVSNLELKAQGETSQNQVDVQLMANKQIRVWYLNSVDEKVCICVYNSREQLIKKESFKKEGNLKVKFDFSNLPADTYMVKVFKNKELVRAEKVTLNEDRLCSIPYLVDESGSNLAKE